MVDSYRMQAVSAGSPITRRAVYQDPRSTSATAGERQHIDNRDGRKNVMHENAKYSATLPWKNPRYYAKKATSTDSPARSVDSRSRIVQNVEYEGHRNLHLQQDFGTSNVDSRNNRSPQSMNQQVFTSLNSTSQTYIPPTPVVFGNLYETGSVATGMSQQELLRKKVREESKKKRSKKQKQKRSPPIFALPPTLTFGIKNSTSHQYDNVNSIAGSDPFYEEHFDHRQGKEKAVYAKKQAPRTPNTSDYYEQSTAESTLTYEATRCVNPRGIGYGAPAPYSTVPMQQTIVNNSDGSMFEWSGRNDCQSVESFPILSNHCGLSLSGLENSTYFAKLEEKDDLHIFQITSKSQISERNNTSESSSDSKRAVRFSQSSFTHQDSNSSIPWDEREHENRYARYDRVRDNKNYEKPQTKQKICSPRLGDDKPKSILRSARYATTSSSDDRSTSSYYAKIQAFRERHAHRFGNHFNERYTTCTDNTPVSKSPPRNGSRFTDMEGGELSPIRPSSRTSSFIDEHKTDGMEKMYPVRSEYGIYNVQKRANSTAGVEPCDDYSKYSDPGLDSASNNSDLALDRMDVDDLPMDNDFDDLSVLSAADFIQTIAAIVIQAAVRRYRTQWIYSGMLARRKSQRLCQSKGPKQLNYRYIDGTQQQDTSIVDQCRTVDHRRECAHRTNSAGLEMDVNDAATKIQALFRAYWARDCISVDMYCATLIQKTWRTYQKRHDYIYELYSIIVVQSIWRRSIARNRINALNVPDKDLIDIKSVIRMWQERSRKTELAKHY